MCDQCQHVGSTQMQAHDDRAKEVEAHDETPQE